LMGLIFLFAGDYFFGAQWTHWQVMVFSTLAFSRISLALAMRSEHDFVFGAGFWANKPMLGAVGLTFVLQMLVIYVPWLQGMFSTQGLSPQELGICLVMSTVGFWAVEAQKLFFRRRG
ncbi:cation transporting ATPase C-terminal domain-containing protein, partial [Trichothermofontia sp.]